MVVLQCRCQMWAGDVGDSFDGYPGQELAMERGFGRDRGRGFGGGGSSGMVLRIGEVIFQWKVEMMMREQRELVPIVTIYKEEEGGGGRNK